MIRFSALPLLILAAATLQPAAGLADEKARGSDTPRCKEATDAIVLQTGAEFDRASGYGTTVFFKHPLAREMSLNCQLGAVNLSVFVSTGTAFPPAAYYDLVAKAGAAVTKRSVKQLKADAQRCHLAALKSTDETEELHVAGVQTDCQAYTRDGGSTNITIALDAP